MVKVAVVGASGYAGAQLCRIISRHEKLELTGLFVSENSLDKGKKISETVKFNTDAVLGENKFFEFDLANTTGQSHERDTAY